MHLARREVLGDDLALDADVEATVAALLGKEQLQAVRGRLQAVEVHVDLVGVAGPADRLHDALHGVVAGGVAEGVGGAPRRDGVLCRNRHAADIILRERSVAGGDAAVAEHVDGVLEVAAQVEAVVGVAAGEGAERGVDVADRCRDGYRSSSSRTAGPASSGCSRCRSRRGCSQYTPQPAASVLEPALSQAYAHMPPWSSQYVRQLPPSVCTRTSRTMPRPPTAPMSIASGQVSTLLMHCAT